MSHVKLLCCEFLMGLLCILAVTFEDFPSDDTRIKTFWEALNNFTSSEQPLRFSLLFMYSRVGQGMGYPLPCSLGMLTGGFPGSW